MGIANKALVYSDVLAARTLCTRIVRKLFLGGQSALSLWSIRYSVSSPGNGQDTLMISCPEIATTSVMCSVKGLACQSFQVKHLIYESGIVYMCCVGLEGMCDGSGFVSLSLNRLGESFCACWRHSLGSSRNHSNAGGSLSLSHTHTHFASLEPKWYLSLLWVFFFLICKFGILQLKQAKTELLSASKVAYRFLSNVRSNVTNISPQGPGTVNSSDNGSLRIQGTWLKGMLNTSKPSTSTETDNKDEDANHAIPNQQKKQSHDSFG